MVASVDAPSGMGKEKRGGLKGLRSDALQVISRILFSVFYTISEHFSGQYLFFDII